MQSGGFSVKKADFIFCSSQLKIKTKTTRNRKQKDKEEWNAGNPKTEMWGIRMWLLGSRFRHTREAARTRPTTLLICGVASVTAQRRAGRLPSMKHWERPAFCSSVSKVDPPALCERPAPPPRAGMSPLKPRWLWSHSGNVGSKSCRALRGHRSLSSRRKILGSLQRGTENHLPQKPNRAEPPHRCCLRTSVPNLRTAGDS